MNIVFKENRESVRQAPSKTFELSYEAPLRQNINGGGKKERRSSEKIFRNKYLIH
jgi:hypothetical protein